MVSMRVLGTVSVLVLGACNSDMHPSNGAPPQLKTNLGINLAGVKGFVIAPVAKSNAGGAGVDVSTIDQLFTLNADGSLTTVTVTTTTDGDGTSSSTSTMTEVPSAVFDTKAFVLFAFGGVSYQDKICSMVAARKADSALYCLDLSSPPNWGFAGAGLYYPQIDSDATGDFITVQTGGMVSLDFTGSSGPTQTRIVDQVADGMTTQMATNSRGDILASVSGAARIYRRGAGFENHGPETDCYVRGIGTDAASFYYVKDGVVGGGDAFFLHKLTPNGATFDDTQVFDDTARTVGIDHCKSGTGSLVKSGTMIYQALYGVQADAAPRNYFVELVNASGTPVRHTATAIDTIQLLRGFDTGLVIIGLDPVGNSMMQRWLAAGDSYTTVLPPGAYAVTKTSVSPTGEITFTGRRLMDNARVLGTIPADSTTVAIVPQTFAGDVVQIQRIN